MRQTILQIYRAFEMLDADLLDSNFDHSEDLLAFGTDQDEKFEGWSQYKDIHAIQFKALKSFRFTMKELDVHVDKNNQIAWVSDRPHWELETKEGEKLASDVRITAVLKRDSPKNEEWKVVQWHVSKGLNQRLHDY